MKTIKIFDTTLRDGEQSPGCSMNLQEKIEVARQLEKLGVDTIEAGFAIASQGDFMSVKAVAQTVKNASVASLSRALKKDIDRSYEAVKGAQAPRIHTFLATSPIRWSISSKCRPTRYMNRPWRWSSMQKRCAAISSFPLKTLRAASRNFIPCV